MPQEAFNESWQGQGQGGHGGVDHFDGGKGGKGRWGGGGGGGGGVVQYEQGYDPQQQQQQHQQQHQHQHQHGGHFQQQGGVGGYPQTVVQVQGGADGQQVMVVPQDASFAPPGQGSGRTHTGVVKRWNLEKGYGFIQPIEGGDDVFVHHTVVHSKGFRSLMEGSVVEYEIIEIAPSRIRATKVTGMGKNADFFFSLLTEVFST